MKSSATISAERAMITLSDLVAHPVDEEESDALFLESLVAEANRTLDSLQAINLVVEEQTDATSVCVAYRESNREICRISGGEIADLANKVRHLHGMLYDGATGEMTRRTGL